MGKQRPQEFNEATVASRVQQRIYERRNNRYGKQMTRIARGGSRSERAARYEKFGPTDAEKKSGFRTEAGDIERARNDRDYVESIRQPKRPTPPAMMPEGRVVSKARERWRARELPSRAAVTAPEGASAIKRAGAGAATSVLRGLSPLAPSSAAVEGDRSESVVTHPLFGGPSWNVAQGVRRAVHFATGFHSSRNAAPPAYVEAEAPVQGPVTRLSSPSSAPAKATPAKKTASKTTPAKTAPAKKTASKKAPAKKAATKKTTPPAV